MEIKTIEFNGKKYRPVCVCGRWVNRSTTNPRTYLSRDMWCFYTNEVLGNRDIIHHINRDSLDDRMSNFEKYYWGLHSSKHLTGIKRSEETRRKISIGKSKPNPVRSLNILGENNPNWKGGFSNSYKYSPYRNLV